MGFDLLFGEDMMGYGYLKWIEKQLVGRLDAMDGASKVSFKNLWLSRKASLLSTALAEQRMKIGQKWVPSMAQWVAGEFTSYVITPSSYE